MNIIANKNIFEPVIEFLMAEGHKVISVRNSPLAGAFADLIYEKTVKDKLVILTMDRDFSRIIRFPPERCGGIIVVKLYRMTVDKTTEILQRCLQSLNEELIAGRLVNITKDGVRFRTSKEAEQEG